MENSFNSSAGKPLRSASFESAAEESGWTAYLEDPSAANDCDSFGMTSSLVSDAASHAAWKISNAGNTAVCGGDVLKIPKKLNFKQKAQFFIDASLEDTASSPDNSPKVADMGPFDVSDNHHRKISSDYISSSLGKGCIEDERNMEVSFKRKGGAGHTDLKKRGLCLVPLSMFANYMG